MPTYLSNTIPYYSSQTCKILPLSQERNQMEHFNTDFWRNNNYFWSHLIIKSWNWKNVLLIELIIALKLYYIKTSIPSKKFHSDPTSIFILFGNGNLKNHVKVTRPVPIIHNLLTLKESQNRSGLLLILFDKGRREFLTLHS